MKFGKTFINHQIPEWSSYYINYKDLKKQIKLIVKVQDGNETERNGAIAGFFFALDRNVEKVDEFYNRQYTEYEKRFKKISTLIDHDQSDPQNLELDDEEIEELSSILLELRSAFRNLKWFGELNKRGFVKILKKFDKKTSSNQQSAYLNSRIYPLLFANEAVVVEMLSLITEYLGKFSASLSDPANNTQPSTKTTTNYSKILETLTELISLDDDEQISQALTTEYKSNVTAKLLITLLNRAAMCQSFKSIKMILSLLQSLRDPSDINGRNFFHHHIISLAKRQDPSTSSPYINNHGVAVSSLIELSSSRSATPLPAPSSPIRPSPSNSLRIILDAIPPYLRPTLSQRDHRKRTPLHYACKYGLVDETKTIIEYLRKWNEWDSNISSDDISVWGDSEFLTPLNLAILGRQLEVVKVLIGSSKDQKLTDSKSLILATRLDSPELLRTLLSCKGLDINYKDENDETALFIASKLNYPLTVEFLLSQNADPEIKEASYGWTPIFIASIQGYKEVAALLKSSGAKYDDVDESGWLPMEHACLRGHLEIADLLKPADYEVTKVKPYLDSNAKSSEEVPELKDAEPVKSFGHKFLKENESMIVITLGSNDTRTTDPVIKLDKVPISNIHSTKLDTALSLKIHRKGASSENQSSAIIDLPIDDIEPIIINSSLADPGEDVIFFDIVPTYGEHQILGRGVALVKNLTPKVGRHRTLLNKACSISILEMETLDVLGTVNFELLIVTPFHHPNMTPKNTETYWKSLITSRVIGHRGLGKNYNKSDSLQLGENTVESFIAAASLGASYVEFDVQLTKDSQPVIYHDFLVAESGVDIPMHELTLEQFLHLSDMNGNNSDLSSSSSSNSSSSDVPETKDLKSKFRQRSSSHSVHLDRLSKDAELNRANLEKMKLTRTYKVNQGFKGNSRGLSIASSFVTLKDLFKKVPKNVGFNIECKYPLLYELQDEDLGEVFIELNHWIDTVLQTVFDHADGRDVIFSSFHPEACLLLSLKQPSIPVLFLTESGTSYMPDTRTDSLQSAIRFCKKWNLLGIVSESKPILKCPRLVSIVKQQGLVCFTYGSENNNPINSKIQMNSGVDAVIVDSVLAVRKGLQAKDTTTSMFTI